MHQSTLFSFAHIGSLPAISSLKRSVKQPKAGPKNEEKTKAKQIFTFPKTETKRKETDTYIPYEEDKVGCFIYPKDESLRDYQMEAVKECIKQNTLLCLPTGSGKTFIAATVLMNFHRWYPKGIVLFIAPTRSLVTQQSNVCLSFTKTVPQNECCILYGNEKRRNDVWQKSHIFFTTPQVVQNDLTKNLLDPTKIVSIIFDEAHHARGKHPYAEIVKLAVSRNKKIRIIGLTATPGSDRNAVQEVICKTLASSIFYISPNDERLNSYKFETNQTTVKVSVGDHSLGDKLYSIMEETAKPLREKGLIKAKELTRGSVWIAMEERKKYEENEAFCALLSLASMHEKLTRYGPSFLVNQLNDFETNKVTAAKEKIIASDDYKNLKIEAEKKRNDKHPKLIKLSEILSDYFSKYPQSRCIVFAQFRDACESIVNGLSGVPNVRCSLFVGKSQHGINDSTQKNTIELFSEGKTNVLVATCVAEEGIDIGDVGLIVCFDAQSSPIRSIQRMGRTGRHCEGNVITLVSEGAEEKTLYRSRSNNKQVSKILSNTSWADFYPNEMMLPEEMKCVLLVCKEETVVDKSHDSADLILDDADEQMQNTTSKKKHLTKKQSSELKQTFGMIFKYNKLSLNFNTETKQRYISPSESSYLLQEFGKFYKKPRTNQPMKLQEKTIWDVSDSDDSISSDDETSSYDDSIVESEEETKSKNKEDCFDDVLLDLEKELTALESKKNENVEESSVTSPLGPAPCNAPTASVFSDEDDFDFPSL